MTKDVMVRLDPLAIIGTHCWGDPTGMTSLGVDISNAGTARASQHKFVQTLPSEHSRRTSKLRRGLH